MTLDEINELPKSINIKKDEEIKRIQEDINKELTIE